MECTLAVGSLPRVITFYIVTLSPETMRHPLTPVLHNSFWLCPFSIKELLVIFHFNLQKHSVALTKFLCHYLCPLFKTRLFYIQYEVNHESLLEVCTGTPAQEKGRGRDLSKGHHRYDSDVIPRDGCKR